MSADTSTHALPGPIKPRALKRTTDFDGWKTSDGRYEARAARYGTDRRVRFWTVKDLRGTFPGGDRERLYPTLDDIRLSLCAPLGHVPWLVCDMDSGILRVATSRKTAVGWSRSFTGGAVLKRVLYPGSEYYDYEFGDKGDDRPTCFFIMRADVAHRHGFDPVQQPRCPYPDSPFETVRRDGESNEEGYR